MRAVGRAARGPFVHARQEITAANFPAPQTNTGNTSLHYAAEKGHAVVVGPLLTAGAAVDAKARGSPSPSARAPPPAARPPAATAVRAAPGKRREKGVLRGNISAQTVKIDLNRR